MAMSIRAVLNGARWTHVSRRMLAGVGSLIAAMLLPVVAHATCSQAASGIANIPITMPATVTIPRDTPIGKVIAQASYAVVFDNQHPVGVSCDANTTVTFTNLQGAGANSNGVQPIGNTGLGYKIYTGAKYYTAGTFPLTPVNFEPPQCTGNTGNGLCYLFMGPTNTFQLMKIAPVVGNQSVPAGQYMSASVGGIPDSMLSLANSIQVISQTCSVTTPAVAVNLGTVAARTFGAVGSGSTAVPFNIGVDCTGVSTMLAITFTDATNPGNTSTTLPLSSDSTAKGVGIQILNNGTPVAFGPDSSIAGNTNQIQIGQVNNAPTTLSLAGRYVKTASTIGPGSANGMATFTMSYQ
jgi:type 1 fimbria pilin